MESHNHPSTKLNQQTTRRRVEEAHPVRQRLSCPQFLPTLQLHFVWCLLLEGALANRKEEEEKFTIAFSL